MLTFKITEDAVYVRTPYQRREYVKNVLNGVWSQKLGMFKFPKNIHSMRELISEFTDLKFDPEFTLAGKRLAGARDVALQYKSRTDCEGDQRLRPYQRVDVSYLKTLPAALIANEPRTGKTPTSIILMKELGTKKNLVVAPASLVLNWAKEFEQWYPNIDIWIGKGTPQRRKQLYENFKDPLANDKRVLIISKDTWKGDYKHFEGFQFDATFIDEAHYLRNTDTGQSRAVYAIKSRRKYAITGTPTIKHAADIFGILKFLYPNKFTSYWAFVERYFEQNFDYFGHRTIGGIKTHRRTELQEIVGFCGVQRKRIEVMPWLPAKQYITIPCEMESKQAKLYKQMAEDFMAYLEDDKDSPIIDTPNVITQLMRLRQLCLDPQLLGFEVSSAKTKALLEWLDDNREPVVIMSWFTSYLKLLKPQLEKLGWKVGEIHGQMSSVEKQKNAMAFQAGSIDLLLCNIVSAGVGLTLDRAETILFTDKAFTPAEMAQASDRIIPTTKERNHSVSIVSLEVKDTVDERINTILSQKKSITDLINHGGSEAIKNLLRG